MWSTRQLAEIAGVTVRSVRHWHEVGLLPQPQRLSNSYKQYTISDLVLVLRIKRLAGLGFSLEKISTMLVSRSNEKAALLELREEITATLEQLSDTRDDIDHMLALGSAPDLSPQAVEIFQVFRKEGCTREWSIVLAHLLTRAEVAWLVNTLDAPPQEIIDLDQEFSRLPEDSSEDEQQDLTERIVAAAVKITDILRSTDAWNQQDPTMESAIRDMLLGTLNIAQQQVMEQVLDQLARHG